MNQALYAHMNNKRKIKKKKNLYCQELVQLKKAGQWLIFASDHT
jgi:hypothetical protein